MKRYLEVLKNRDFALLWSGFTISQLGDGLSWVALVWFIYELTSSPLAIGLFLLAFTAPTIIGGLAAGVLLDRFDRRKVMIWDNAIRAAAIGLIPLLHALGWLQLWHLYAVGFVFGSLMMISLAGGPALVPSLVRQEELNTANALESLSWSLGDIIGRAAGGLLIGIMGAPNVLILDALTYIILIACLLLMRPANQEQLTKTEKRAGMPQPIRLRDGFQFIYKNKLIFAITIAFLIVNVGAGALGVLLPLFSDTILFAGAAGFGVLTASISFGQLVSSLIVGGLRWRFPLGDSIAVTILLTGAALSLLAISFDLITASAALFLFGVFIAPANIWAQTIRMRVIPEALRGRVFSILRTVIRSTLPLSSALFGLILPLIGILEAIFLAGLLIGLPGLFAILAKSFAEPAPEPAPEALS